MFGFNTVNTEADLVSLAGYEDDYLYDHDEEHDSHDLNEQQRRRDSWIKKKQSMMSVIKIFEDDEELSDPDSEIMGLAEAAEDEVNDNTEAREIFQHDLDNMLLYPCFHLRQVMQALNISEMELKEFAERIGGFNFKRPLKTWTTKQASMWKVLDKMKVHHCDSFHSNLNSHRQVSNSQNDTTTRAIPRNLRVSDVPTIKSNSIIFPSSTNATNTPLSAAPALIPTMIHPTPPSSTSSSPLMLQQLFTDTNNTNNTNNTPAPMSLPPPHIPLLENAVKFFNSAMLKHSTSVSEDAIPIIPTIQSNTTSRRKNSLAVVDEIYDLYSTNTHDDTHDIEMSIDMNEDIEYDPELLLAEMLDDLHAFDETYRARNWYASPSDVNTPLSSTMLSPGLPILSKRMESMGVNRGRSMFREELY